MNSWNITGNLGSDPETRAAGSGHVCGFSVAVKQRGTDAPLWVRVSVWGRQGETCQEHLRKGREVAITGRLEVRKYNDNAGVERTSIELNADSVTFIGGRGDNDGNSATNFQRPNAATLDADIPF